MIFFNKTFGGILWVGGTCVGAGMLALPLASSAMGFYYAMAAFVGCWLMMSFSALLSLEATLAFPEQSNFITMTQATLGKVGKNLAWLCCLCFLYTLMAAYTSASAGIITDFLQDTGIRFYHSMLLLLVVLIIILVRGEKSFDKINRLFMLGLVVAYALLIMVSLPKVDSSLLISHQPVGMRRLLPLLVTSFGFHLLIPSLRNYLQSDIKALRIAIIGGGFLALGIYVVWELVVLGTVPPQVIQQFLLKEAQGQEQAVVGLIRYLGQISNFHYFAPIAQVFAFCAIFTSFMGVAFGFCDFMADGLGIKKDLRGKLYLMLLTFIPPALIVLIYPQFMQILRYAAIFAAILLIVYPALMAWQVAKQTPKPFRWSKKIGILGVLFFGMLIIVGEILP